MGAADRLDTAWRDEAARIDQEMTTLTQDLTDTRALVEDLQDRLGEEQQTTADLTRRLAASDAAVADLDTRLRASTALVEQHAATIAQQAVTIDQQRARIVELEAHECAPTEPFIPGVTRPQSTAIGDPITNVGRQGHPLVAHAGSYTIAGSDNPLRPTVFIGVDFDKIVTVQSGYVDFDLCRFRGTNATTDTGLIDTRAAGVKRVRVRRSEFDPGQAGAHWWINGVIGHHIEVEQSIFRRVVDAGNFYNNHSDELAVIARDNVVEWLFHAYNPTKGIVHPSDVETHNDTWHIQGSRGFLIENNVSTGLVFQADGKTLPATPARQGQPWQGLAGNFVMAQHNVRPVGDGIVINNRFGGHQNGIVARTRDYDKGAPTPWTLEAWGNVVTDLAHRWYSTTSRDAHNVLGGKWYGARFDNQVSHKGKGGTVRQWRTDHVEYLPGISTYDTTDLIDPARRGKDVPGRSDSFAGGKQPPA